MMIVLVVTTVRDVNDDGINDTDISDGGDDRDCDINE